MELITLKSFDNALEANLLVAYLENNGIEAIVENDQSVLINPGALVASNIKVRVLKKEKEISEKLLASFG